ncbi:DUF4157 domain-containing protein [Oxalobacteraceae bacterium]|nr:DUF4157 domain-containing protein [Oxalobacteraceae bacterium]
MAPAASVEPVAAPAIVADPLGPSPVSTEPSHDAGLPDSVGATLAQPGQALDQDTRSDMESRFGADFGGVRLHTDSAAADSASDVDAHAYTVGQHVVFGQGQYQPQSETGRQLLAHELAHTVQQQGLQRAGVSSLPDQGPEYRRLEAEADHMADAALRGRPLPTSRASQPMLSRAGKTRTLEPGGEVPLSVTPVAKSLHVTSAYMESDHTVKPEGTYARAEKGKAPVKLETYTVDKFFVPGTKGPRALAIYKSLASAGGLQATIDVSGRSKAILWQERADTGPLQTRWLRDVGWPGGKQADALWQAAGGDAEFPKVGKKTCQMDHVVELQIGGNNTEQNIQALDETQNRNSGGAIKNQVFMLAQQVAADNLLSSTQAEQITLRFLSADPKGAVEQPSAACPPTGAEATCLSVEQCARKGGATPGVAAATADLDKIELSAGGAPTAIMVAKTFQKDSKAKAKIYGDPVNNAAGELIPGLLLNELHHTGTGKKKGLGVRAIVDDRDATRLPLTLEGKERNPVNLKVEEDGKLKLAEENLHIKFQYKYLSPGEITKMSRGADGSLQWKGYIKPKVAFLGRLDVEYDKGELTVSKGLDPKDFKSPFPGATLTEAKLALKLAPVFKPEGSLAFDFGTTRKLASARVTASADAEGLVLQGKLQAFLPGVDNATGDVKYQNGQWSGAVLIEAAALQSKLKYVQSGQVSVGLKNGKLEAGGKVQLVLPGDAKAELDLKYRNNAWLFTGKGEFKVDSPYLKPIQASISYDGDLFKATGTAGFGFKGILDGTINATYENRNGAEKIYGKGNIKISKGRANGDMDVELHPNQKVTGKGKLSYEIKKGMVATATIIVDEKQKITFEGDLTLPDIQLFKRFPASEAMRSIFSVSASIPIPGASIGPVGLKVKLYGGMDYYYYVGPGVLTGIKATVKFSPFEADPDFAMKLHAKASIPAGGGIRGKLGADIAIDAGIAEVGGGLSVYATAGLEGKAELGGEISYEKDRFAIDAKAYVGGKITLEAGLNAHAYAEAGVLALKVRTEKEWNLAKTQLDTGITIGMELPLHYDSQSEFKMPSMADIKLVPEKIDLNPGHLLDQLFNRSKATQKEAG